MTANEIRDSFKKFFESKGHTIVPSAPMVIKDDPTLMFTNAGMNQWKDIILGTREPEPRRRADTQKCLRVSGKHNDLEEVGHDTYHHTMFEMLGNWSFGDYFKEGAIDYAWEYLVDVLKLNPADLYVTVFEGSEAEGLKRDDEAASYWAKHVPADHIINGNKHDNFWEMGDTGPCGPCSEIHLDSRTPEEKAKTPGRELVNKDDPQVIEIWNIVFMQYERKANGSLVPLPMHVIDTGMGFERLVRAMQGKHSNYDTDIFQPIIKEEEDSFLRTLEKGINLLSAAMEELKKQGKTQLDGVQAFRLFDTYGFPLDLTELICRENGFTVDEEEFDAEMKKQKDRARNAAAVENSDWVNVREGEQQFVGYDYTEYECHILRYRKVTQKKNTYYEIVLDYTPFYGEMGGQVGDTGVLVSEDETVTITDTKRENGQSVHIVKELPKNPEADFMACVNTDERDASAANHTATHLLDYALKQVLGDHVEQKGSFVSPTTLRFDFSHFSKVTDEELRKVERIVNDMIRQDIALDEHRDTPFEEAKKLGAIALFGEKYGDKVRVVRFGPSCEFCGGIHVKSTGRIGFFKIISESSVAAGIRRIEAKTGKECEELLYNIEDSLKAIRALFNNAKDLQAVIGKYIEEHDAMKKNIEQFQAQAVERTKTELVQKAREVNGVKVITAVLPMEPAAAKDLMFKLRQAVTENMLAVIGTVSHDKPMLNVAMSDDLVKEHSLNAGKMVREAAKLIQGGGGGQPHFAQAGGKNADGLSAAVDKVVELANL